MAGEYDKLMSELDEILAKAQAVDTDEKIEAAADGQDMPGAADKDADPDDDAAEDQDGESFMKSFRVTLEDGTEQEAYDATAMMKAMHVTARRQAETIDALQARVKEQDAVIQRLPDMLKAMQGQIASQADMLKALREAPGGRKTTTQAPVATPQTTTRGDILAKALSLQTAGKIGSTEVAVIEARLNARMQLPNDLAALISAA